MPSNETTRVVRKLTAIRRAERRLGTRLADIDWEIDVLKPELAEVKMTGVLDVSLEPKIAEIEGPR